MGNTAIDTRNLQHFRKKNGSNCYIDRYKSYNILKTNMGYTATETQKLLNIL
jgi:hypothetical protein